jgi:hypothetical protein
MDCLLFSKDNLIILGGKINIDSVGKAIKGKDSVSIENADITINAEDTGITTDGATEVTIATGGNTVGERTSKGPGAFDKRRTGRKF